MSCAQIATIPTKSPIDAKAAASSTKTLNITALPSRTLREHSSLFVLRQDRNDALSREIIAVVNTQNRFFASGQRKNPGQIAAGVFRLARSESSVTRHDRAAELVIKPGGKEIDILPNAIGSEGKTGGRGEALVAAVQEQMVVFEAERPVRG